MRGCECQMRGFSIDGAVYGLPRRIVACAEAAASYALLTILYRSTDPLCRAGALVKNLAHVPSLSMAFDSVPLYNWD
jgi:hypothetical protein